MKTNVTVQIYTGSFYAPDAHIDLTSLKAKFTKIYQKAHVECVMIGWNPNADISILKDFLKQHGTDVYLWLPVFSDWHEMAPLIGMDNLPVTQDYQAEKGERFEFGCPAHIKSIKNIKEIFEKKFRNDHYDGIFLDKIRFPSFISGLQPVLTCFCSYCRSLHGISEKIMTHGDENPLAITAYDRLHYHSEDKDIAQLFDYKAKVVTSSIADLHQYFREQGFKIGLDLFAPFLSWFVGQDYLSLAQYADFIKPMFYRETYAPAGLPYEIDKYATAFGDGLKMTEVRKRNLLNLLKTNEIDIDFINREIKDIRNQIGNVKLYAGIEVNYNEKIAPVKAPYIQENLKKMSGADGFAFSWDLCSTPDENLDAALECL